MGKVIKAIVAYAVITSFLAMIIPNMMLGAIASADEPNKVSTIAGVEIAGLKHSEKVALLTEAVQQWYTKPLVVSGGGKTIQVSAESFRFDIEGTVDFYERTYEKKWYELWRQNTTVHLPLTLEESNVVKDELRNVAIWQMEPTYMQMESNASYLLSDEVQAAVISLELLENERLALFVHPIPEDAAGMDDLISELNGSIIESNQHFSLLQKSGEAIHLANSEAINFVASALYNVALYSEAEINERHAQSTIPSYSKPGLEATVNAFTNEDLSFTNTLTTPVLLKLTADGQKLIAATYSTNKVQEVLVTASHTEEIQPRTIIRYSNELAIGRKKELQKGQSGQRVAVYRTVAGEQQLISKDYYPPVNHVVMKSSKKPKEETNEGNLQSSNANTAVNEGGESGITTPGSAVAGETNIPSEPVYDKGGNLVKPPSTQQSDDD